MFKGEPRDVFSDFSRVSYLLSEINESGIMRTLVRSYPKYAAVGPGKLRR